MRRSTSEPQPPPGARQGSGGAGNVYLFQIFYGWYKQCRSRCKRREKRRKSRAVLVEMAQQGTRSIKGATKTVKLQQRRKGRVKMASYVDETQGRRGYLQGGSEKEKRLFAIRVDVTAVGESVTEVVGTALELKDYVSELHIVVPYSPPGTAEQREREPMKGLYEGSQADYRSLSGAGIEVYLHPRRFHARLQGSHIRRMIYAPSLVDMKADVFEELLEEYMTPHFHKEGYRRYRYSIRTKIEEPGFSLWTPVLVAMLVYDWWRSLFTQFFRTVAPKDVVVYPVNHADYGPFIPEERRLLGLWRGVGFIQDRARPFCPEDGVTCYIPKDWTGWERVVWLAQRTDLIGVLGGFIGWPLLCWFVSVPYWNLVVPWLEVEVFGYVRLGIWALHGCFMAMVLNRFYAGPLQNLVVFFGVPLAIVPMMPILLWAKYGVSHPGAKRRNTKTRKRSVPEPELEPEPERNDEKK